MKDAIIKWLIQQREKTITQNLETGNSTEQKRLNICKIFKQITLESLGKKKKWHRKRGMRLWDEELGNIIDDKRNAVKRYTATRSHEDKIEYKRRNMIPKRETQIKMFKIWKDI